MLEKYITQFTNLEKIWYSRSPNDNDLAEGLVTWLNQDNTDSLIELTPEINLKYFVRSYRAAFEKMINSKINRAGLDAALIKANEDNKKNGKLLHSRITFLNSMLKKILKHNLHIRIDDVDLEISSNPATSHLGNGYVRNIGKYSDIWPMLNLITDCKEENNKKLATLFLSFANHPYKFTKVHLSKINPKFGTPEFNSTVDYFCKFLTGIAMHFIFYESARRVVLTVEEDNFNAEAPQDITVASSIIIVLKALKDGYPTRLEDAFSPDSKYILITREGVSKQTKKEIQSAVTSMSKLGLNRVEQEHQKKEVTPNDMVAHMLYPDSEDFDSEDTETYTGVKIKLGKT